MAKFEVYDPLSDEAKSDLIAGLTGAVNKLSSVLNLKTSTFTDLTMEEIYIDNDDRYRLFQVSINNKGWVSSPAPVIKKNGTVITGGFEINYIGGSIEFLTIEDRPTASDTITASATYIIDASQAIETINQLLADVGAKANKNRGTFTSLDNIEASVSDPQNGDYAVVISATDNNVYIYNTSQSKWLPVGSETDLSNYYTIPEINTALSNKEPLINAHSDASTSDNYFYGGRKTWVDLFLKVRSATLTGISTATNSLIGASDTVLTALGKLQAQVTALKTSTENSVTSLGNNKVDKSTGKSLVLDTEIAKLQTVEQNAEQNVIESISVNGVTQTITNKNVELEIETGLFPALGTPIEDMSWEQISLISNVGIAENYFAIGDKKSIYLNGTCGTLALNQTLYAFILGFDHNSAIEGGGITFGTFKNADGKDVSLVDSKYNGYGTVGGKYFNMNHGASVSDSTNAGGWKNCAMRFDILGSVKTKNLQNATSDTASSPLAETLMSCLPSNLRNVLKPITKYSDNTGGGVNSASYVTTTVDYLPLLAEFEIRGINTSANSAERNHQKQYDYYVSGNSKVKYKHNDLATASIWLGRSVGSSYPESFIGMSASGSHTIIRSSYCSGVAPAFLI